MQNHENDGPDRRVENAGQVIFKLLYKYCFVQQKNSYRIINLLVPPN